MKNIIRNCIITLIGALVLFMPSCIFFEDPGTSVLYQEVVVENQTDEDILIFTTINKYPEIIEENLMSMYGEDKTEMLSAKSSTVLGLGFGVIEETGMPNLDMLLVMIIRRSTLDKYPLGYLIENNIYDDMFLLSYDELKLMNFEIIYND